jgi:hypothetical protein
MIGQFSVLTFFYQTRPFIRRSAGFSLLKPLIVVAMLSILIYEEKRSICSCSILSRQRRNTVRRPRRLLLSFMASFLGRHPYDPCSTKKILC